MLLPFFLVYSSKAILPTDVTFGASRIEFYEEEEAEQTHRVDLDSLEAQRMVAVMMQARHDQQLRRYHDRNIKETSFNVGDLVIRRIQKTDDMHKLSAPWEGPASSPKSLAHPHIASNGETGKAYPTHGTWSTYDSIHRIVLL
jgi:hypothetical protein